MRGHTTRSDPGGLRPRFTPVSPLTPALEKEALGMAEPTRKRKPKRLRAKLIQVRVSEAELAEVAEAADRMGLTVASYSRRRLLGHEPPRAVRRPPLDRVMAARVLAALGPIATDVRELGRRQESTAPAVADREKLDGALAALTAMREMVMKALRREP